MLKKILLILSDKAFEPFRGHLLFMISLFVFTAIPCILGQIYSDYYYYALLLSLHCFILAYLATLAVSLIRPKSIRLTVKVLLIAASVLYFGLNFYSVHELGGLIDEDYLMLIVNTNPHEANEFATAMLPGWIVLAVAGIFVLFIFFWWLSSKYNMNLGKKASIVAVALLLICIAQNIRNWIIWEDGPVKHISELLSATSDYEVPDASIFNQTSPSIVLNEDSGNDVPANVVLIIGESFARFHSSLYGYDKPTNPCLGAMRENHQLFTFDSINTPASTTSMSLKFMLSEFGKNDKSSKKWYEYASIIEIMRSCGYECLWMSNQARAGRFNYIARFFGEASDRYWFLQNEGVTQNNTIHDAVLVDSTDLFFKEIDDDHHHFIVYHMMGSHFDYSLRYTDEFSRFKENDYMNCPKSQREILANYDNSILYNDFIVNQIMNIYSNTESLVLYVPDHGQDMFTSSPDYFIHGKSNDSISYDAGVKIPFMIYASPKFRQKYPNIIDRIENRQNHPKSWNCDDLPYLILDLMGVKELNGVDVKSKSIL